MCIRDRTAEQLSELGSTNTDLKQRLDKSEKNASHEGARAVRLEAELSDLKVQHSADSSKQEAEYAALRVKVARGFEDELAAEKKRTADTKQQLKSKSKHANELEKENARLIAELERIQEQLTEGQRKQAKTAEQLSELGSVNTNLKQQLDKSETDLQDAKVAKDLQAASEAGSTQAAVSVQARLEEEQRVSEQKTKQVATLQEEHRVQAERLKVAEDENERLKARSKTAEGAELPEGFEFGERVYQCVQAPPGVGYRFTPDFGDKNKDGSGPESPQVIVANAICQGPKAIFVHGTSGRGWLPITDPSGSKILFKHLGRVEDVDLSQHELNDGERKLGQSQSYAAGGDMRTSTLDK
eukprot:TRINITY_DN11936_c0_g2_i14.p1 TRINITY_DN11936_c0_g2~~TRINITY_DN11936_c0_g2_i14.p1  ORF type:complete len:356 (+),score=116.40 TRINITY_DN11936_c0_g2_i14:67-1134(+)